MLTHVFTALFVLIIIFDLYDIVMNLQRRPIPWVRVGLGAAWLVLITILLLAHLGLITI